MIDPQWAEQFAREWVLAWNNRDLDAVLAHYAEDVIFHSPRIAAITGKSLLCLNGTATLRSYWAQALESSPHLQFVLETVLVGSDALTILYRNHRHQLVAETFLFDLNGLVTRSVAAYK